MRLFELFESADDRDSLVNALREDVIDFIMPLAAHGVPFLPLEKLISVLKGKNVGIEIDKPLVMKVCDPNEVKLITRIDGNKVYFKVPEPVSPKSAEDVADKNKTKVKSSALAQIKKELAKK